MDLERTPTEPAIKDSNDDTIVLSKLAVHMICVLITLVGDGSYSACISSNRILKL